MEKRLLVYFAVMLCWLYLWGAIYGPKKPAPDAAGDEPAAAAKAEQDEPAAIAKEVQPPAEPSVAEAAPPAEQEKPAPQTWVSLGSGDPGSPYRMLVLLNSQGAAVERIELNNDRFHDLEDEERPGHLGHLEPADAQEPQGALVQVVPTGSVADRAELKVGDIITEIEGAAIKSAADLTIELHKYRPGKTVSLIVSRGGETKKLSATLRRQPLQLIRPEAKLVPQDNLTSADVDPLSFLLTLSKVGDKQIERKQVEIEGVNLRTGQWEVVEQSPSTATFRRTLPALQLEVTKKYELASVPEGQGASPDAKAYHLRLQVQIKNLADRAQSVVYRLDGPTGLPLEGRWYANKVTRESLRDLRNVVGQFVGAAAPAEFSTTKIVDGTDPSVQPRIDAPFQYLGVDAQYFSVMLLPQVRAANESWFHRVEPIAVGEVPAEASQKHLTSTTFRLESQEAKLAAGEVLDNQFEIFAGPKRPHLLEQYHAPYAVEGENSLRDLLYYGWFGFVARPMLAILHVFYSIVSAAGIRTYALPIVMLTVLVRGALFPISRKQQLGAQKMQALQPEIKRINEKYKSDAQARGKATQELFRRHQYNPLGGCLLAFLQLPIFVGLYRALTVDVELRQSPILGEGIRWGSNLAAPDMLWHWADVAPQFLVNFLGPYFNLFPIFTIFLFLYQQHKMMPPPADEQAAMQQKMMKYMMIFMGVMFFKVASGLCIYFIATNIWSLCERKFLPKTTPAVALSEGDAAAIMRRKREKR